jgi:hypothetical protein
VDKTRLVAAWLKFKYIQICAFSWKELKDQMFSKIIRSRKWLKN